MSQPPQYDPRQQYQQPPQYYDPRQPAAPGMQYAPPQYAQAAQYAADADRPVLQKRSYSSPLSFTGATSRIIRAASRIENQGLSVTVLVADWLIVLPFVWSFIVIWYTVIFGLFGIFAIPWRLHRRSQRRAQHLAEAQLSAFQRFSAGGQHPDYRGR